MASLLLKGIYKVYPSGVVAVSDFNLDIKDKEFIVFVGPSGCGKSTTLRMIAGLEEISKGELYIDGRLVNDIVPKDRDIAMVFQNYALYPHMTVYDNMAFGLKLRKMPKQLIDEKVKEAARILGIDMYLSRKPKALSGGQKQRVALGRAIVREPKVFLLDEPLSNLDAKLRAQMRTEITKLHNRLATTFVYVTHDQTEAMTMGTRIVVMKDGFMQQVDTPQNLYDYPVNVFVAGFIGTPQMNFFPATLTGTKAKVYVEFGKDKILLPASKVSKINNVDDYIGTGKELILGVRPEDIHEEESFIANSLNTKVKCKVDVVERLGAETLLYCSLDFDPNAKEEENGTIKSLVEDVSNMIASIDSRSSVLRGDIIDVAFDANHIHLFDKETEMTILMKDENYELTESNTVAEAKTEEVKAEVKTEEIKAEKKVEVKPAKKTEAKTTKSK
jgi:multiple sugar transport system ATP-binding protein